MLQGIVKEKVYYREKREKSQGHLEGFRLNWPREEREAGERVRERSRG